MSQWKKFYHEVPDFFKQLEPHEIELIQYFVERHQVENPDQLYTLLRDQYSTVIQRIFECMQH